MVLCSSEGQFPDWRLFTETSCNKKTRPEEYTFRDHFYGSLQEDQTSLMTFQKHANPIHNDSNPHTSVPIGLPPHIITCM